MTQARSLWREGITVTELELFRQSIAGIGLDDCLTQSASALDIISQIGGTKALDDCLEAVRSVQRWWPAPSAGH